MRKPTIQEIADSAGVSRVSVWKVLNNRPGISESLHYQVVTAAIRLGYPLPDSINVPDLNQNIISRELHTIEDSVISVVVSRPDSSVFWVNIIHQIAREISRCGCSLMYTYVPAVISPGYILPAQLTGKTIRGMIILNVYDPRLLTMLNALPTPKVFLDVTSGFPTDTLTGDLLLLEGKETVKKITESLLDQGRKKIGFIGNARYALTNRLRYEGYLFAMKTHRIPVLTEYCKTEGLRADTFTQDLEAYLDSLPAMPEAFVCVNDFTAQAVYRYLSAHGCHVPKDVALTGFDNLPENSETKHFLTTAAVNTSILGRRLIMQLLFRMENPSAPVENVFMKPEILVRGGGL